MPKEGGGPLLTRVAELGENTGAPAFDDSLKWGILVYSAHGGVGPKLEETKMIYLVMVNKSEGWAVELGSMGRRAGCRCRCHYMLELRGSS